MALSPKDAVKLAREILNGPRLSEASRLNRIHDAMCAPSVIPTNAATAASSIEIPSDAPDALKRLARKSVTNYMPLVVDIFSQVMKVDGYYSPGSTERAAPWEWWQLNRMDARQTGVHRGALQYGVSYLTCLPGDRGPVMRGFSPRQMTALYQNPADDEWPMLAAQVDGKLVRLFDEELIYVFGIESSPRSGFASPAATVSYASGSLDYIESYEHGFPGYPPIVRFRDRMLLDGEEQYGIVEPLLTLQDRINETTFGMMVAQFFGAFKQRYVIGWVPDSEAQSMKAAASDAWYFLDPDVKVGQFEESGLKGYIDSKSSAIRDMSAIGQLPAQNLGVDGISNISDATLAGLETSKDRKADEIATSFGESWEQSLRACALIIGDQASAEDYLAEVKWKDSTARSFAQTVDGLGKLATMLNVPQELLWEDIPGWTQQKVDRAKQLLESSNALGGLTRLLEAQAVPPPVAAE